MPQLVKAVDLAQAVRQAKNVAYAVPNQAREVVKAKNKQTAPVASSLEPWWTPIGVMQRIGIAPSVRKTPEEQKNDPRSPWETLGDALPSVGKWSVVGLLALAAIVVVPRLLPRR